MGAEGRLMDGIYSNRQRRRYIYIVNGRETEIDRRRERQGGNSEIDRRK